MQTKHSEQLNIQENAENNLNQNSPLIERLEIAKSPFIAIRKNEKWIITIAQYRLTEEHQELNNALIELEENKWNVIMTMMAIIIDLDKEMTSKKQIQMEFNNNLGS